MGVCPCNRHSAETVNRLHTTTRNTAFLRPGGRAMKIAGAAETGNRLLIASLSQRDKTAKSHSACASNRARARASQRVTTLTLGFLKFCFSLTRNAPNARTHGGIVALREGLLFCGSESPKIGGGNFGGNSTYHFLKSLMCIGSQTVLWVTSSHHSPVLQRPK